MNGAGAGTSYNIEGTASIKKDLAMRFTNAERKKEFVIKNQSAFIEIKKIILTPLFDWSHPDEWAGRLARTGLYLQVTCSNNNGTMVKSSPYPISSGPHHYQPVFVLSQSIDIPRNFWDDTLYKSAHPIQVTIELLSSTPDFDVMLLYDEG